MACSQVSILTRLLRTVVVSEDWDLTSCMKAQTKRKSCPRRRSILRYGMIVFHSMFCMSVPRTSMESSIPRVRYK